ncbi:MAG: hypothetical protein JWO13_922 [Acidobacteriales bacterium]|nr:hypothetical protein [Terriglobales bacterium]
MTDSSSLKRRRPPKLDSGASLASQVLLPITEVEELRAAASSPVLSEELALTLLERRDLPAHVIDDLAKNGRVMKHRKVRSAVVQHFKTPRHVSMPLVRRLYVFELMSVALTPGVPTDVKLAADDSLISKFGTISAGEKLTLGKRGSARVAAGLLNDPDKRIVEAALNNPFLTESWVCKALLRKEPSQILAHHVCHDQKWSVRKDVRVALLRNEFTPLAQAIIVSQSFSLAMLKEILSQSDLPANIKQYLIDIAEKKKSKQAGSGRS